MASAEDLRALVAAILDSIFFEADLRERWAARALAWLLEAESPHLTCRSHQVRLTSGLCTCASTQAKDVGSSSLSLSVLTGSDAAVCCGPYMSCKPLAVWESAAALRPASVQGVAASTDKRGLCGAPGLPAQVHGPHERTTCPMHGCAIL